MAQNFRCVTNVTNKTELTNMASFSNTLGVEKTKLLIAMYYDFLQAETDVIFFNAKKIVWEGEEYN